MDLVAVLVNLLELFWKVWQALSKLFYDDNAKHEPLAIAPERLNHELEGDTLQHIVEEAVLDDGTEELGDLCQVDVRIFVEEPVLVEEAMQHAGVDLLFFDYLRFLEIL